MKKESSKDTIHSVSSTTYCLQRPIMNPRLLSDNTTNQPTKITDIRALKQDQTIKQRPIKQDHDWTTKLISGTDTLWLVTPNMAMAKLSEMKCMHSLVSSDVFSSAQADVGVPVRSRSTGVRTEPRPTRTDRAARAVKQLRPRPHWLMVLRQGANGTDTS